MLDIIIARVKGLILKPAETWIQIKDEETDVHQIFAEYLVILAAIPAVSGFLGAIFKGANFFNSLLWGIFFYVLSLGGIWLTVNILKFLAISFKLTVEELAIYKLVANSYVAFFVAGIFFLIPPFFWLVIVGVYGFYLFIIGLSTLVDCPKDEKFNYIVISTLAVVLVLILVFSLAGLMSGIQVNYLRI